MRLVPSVLVLAVGAPAFAHQLDQYLQATTLSVGRSRVWAYVRLTPGTLVFQKVMARLDTNADGAVSSAEQRAYSARFLRDLTLSIDGHRLKVRLLSAKFPTVAAMRQGVGNIDLNFDAAVPAGSGCRRLVFENRHQPGIGAYLVNCLAPDDAAFRMTGQKRDVIQSRYELSYIQAKTSLPVRRGARQGSG